MSEDAIQRIFVGIALSDDIRHGLAAVLVDRLGGEALPGRPLPPENWHITLRFVGPTDPEQRDRLRREIGESSLGAAFRLGFGGLGAFPNARRASVLWIGVDRGAEELGELAATVEGAVVAAGHRTEERPFHPHLTLSRLRPPRDASRIIGSFGTFPGTMRVDEVTLFRSHLQGSKPARYEALESFSLAG